MICRESKCMTPSQFGKMFPGREFERVVGRGFLYCKVNPKHGIVCVKSDPSAVCNRKSDCEWTIHFQLDINARIYVVDWSLSNVNHSHSINRDSIRASVRRKISYEKEMSSEEMDKIMGYGPALLSVTKARELMRLAYPERDYDGDLLRRLLNKGFDQHFGRDRHGMSRFIEKGNSIRQSGGIFEFDLGPDGRISDVYVMKSSMRSYAALFGDFVVNDGTHDADMYGLVMMINTLVDSLGKSVMCGYSQFRSEQSDHLVRALRHLGLTSEGSTLMTDDGPAYHLVADQLSVKHLLCSKHYMDMVFKSCTGLGVLAKSFQTDMSSAIYTNYKSPDILARHFEECFDKYGHADLANKFMLALQKDQELVCRTHTILVFSAGCKSTQRGEGSNSRHKVGNKKQELRRFSLAQLLEWYLSLVELQEEQSLESIIRLIKSDRLWSEFVHDLWQGQINQV